MMFDLQDLFVTVHTKIGDTAALADIHGEKTYLGQSFKRFERPHCRVTLIPVLKPDRTFDGTNLDRVTLSFSVFSSSLAEANALAKRIAETFVGVGTITLDEDVCLSVRRVGASVGHEGNDAKTFVYRASVDLEFFLQS